MTQKRLRLRIGWHLPQRCITLSQEAKKSEFSKAKHSSSVAFAMPSLIMITTDSRKEDSRSAMLLEQAGGGNRWRACELPLGKVSTMHCLVNCPGSDRSPFASYACTSFFQHIINAPSANDDTMFAISKFFPSRNILV